MSEPTFTPGPWPREYTGDGKRIIIGKGLVEGPNGYEVAEVYSDDCPQEVAEGNAALIAAAPDLYDTLKAITDCYGVGSTPENFCKNVRDFMLEGRAVLARARGEQP